MRNPLPDLFPSSPIRRSSDLGAYQRQARRRPLGWILVLALVIQVGMVVRHSRQPDQPWKVSWSALRTADVDLSAATAADDWPEWIRWVTGNESEAEALDWIAEEFERLAEKGSLDEDGLKVAKQLSELEEGESEPLSEEYWQERFRTGIWSWERMAVERQYGEEPPVWLLEQREYYQQLDRETAIQKALASSVWWLVLILGLPFLPAALRCFSIKNHRPLSPVTRAWEPSMVTVRYVLADVILGFFIIYLYRAIPDSLWYQSFGPTLILTDAVWRIGGPLLFAFFLFVRWRHAWRLLGLHLAPVMKPVLGMISLGIIYDFVLGCLVGQFTLAENLDGLSSDEVGGWGLLYVIISGVILAPLCEEAVFRGILFQSYLRKFGFWGAMLFSTLFFIFIHYYGVYGSFSVAFFGIGACALYRATGSLWTGILFHAITNGLIFGTMWPIYYG